MHKLPPLDLFACTTGGTNMAVDSASVVASLHHSGAKLELKTIDLCFLAALYGRGE